MPLQNRVTPFGRLQAVDSRGTVMGNRGCLHDGERRIVRNARGRRWIICRLAFRERQRTVMTPGRWTELFFLDDATALAAGHRPCAECRRPDFNAFRAAWFHHHPEDAGPVEQLDRRLHAERAAERHPRVACATLPDGAMVVIDEGAWLILGSWVLAWSHHGYTTRRPRPTGDVELLTPPSTVQVLTAGWQPAVHSSAHAA
ncbi:MAG: hypothetical protein JWO02_3221 [Solirubrobacterales bacterium]|nr:hypothetical protein [Solirubrobacterales bacterium]